MYRRHEHRPRPRARWERDRVELLRRADIALYRAKAEGRNCFRTFTPEMDETINVRRIVEEELRIALDADDGLEVAYQPQIAAGGAIVGVEALIRWRHPVRGSFRRASSFRSRSRPG